MKNKKDLQKELVRDHWTWSYSWRGARIDLLEKKYDVPRAEILAIMRNIAHKHDPIDAEKLPKSRCKSCGMRIFWGQLNGENHPYDPQILVGGSVETGKLVRIRESHFVSCPNAKGHRNK